MLSIETTYNFNLNDGSKIELDAKSIHKNNKYAEDRARSGFHLGPDFFLDPSAGQGNGAFVNSKSIVLGGGGFEIPPNDMESH